MSSHKKVKNPYRLRWWQWAFWSSACRYADLREATFRDGGGLLIFAGLLTIGVVAIGMAIR